MMNGIDDHRFTDAEIAGVYRAIAERRDMRHFRPGPVEPALLERLLWAAHHAPSVGYMQPWRFIRITDRALRERLKTEPDAATVHKLISDWEPLKSVA